MLWKAAFIGCVIVLATLAWLPANAQSTQVLNLRSEVVSPNVFAAVVVYERPSGLTAADRAKVTADAAAFARVPGVLHGQLLTLMRGWR